MSESNITAAMRDAIGRQLSRRVSFPVVESDIRRWAIAVYYPQEPPRQFWDGAYAKSTRYGGIVAPEDFNPFAWPIPMAPDRPVGAVPGEKPTRGRNILNGGQVDTFGARMRPGDVITSRLRLVRIRSTSSLLTGAR